MHAELADGRLRADAFVGLPDGSEWVRDALEGDPEDPVALGRELAGRLLSAGAATCSSARVDGMSARAGVVYLVGAGPGDPGLITARALELIATADDPHDRLIGALDAARGDAEAVDVGKRPGNPEVPQRRIEELMVEHAQADRSVVRLKGATRSLSGAAARRPRRWRRRACRSRSSPA